MRSVLTGPMRFLYSTNTARPGPHFQAKAHHPAMLAYRCKGINGVVHQDNDDDVSLSCHLTGTHA